MPPKRIDLDRLGRELIAYACGWVAREAPAASRTDQYIISAGGAEFAARALEAFALGSISAEATDDEPNLDAICRLATVVNGTGAGGRDYAEGLTSRDRTPAVNCPVRVVGEG